MNIKLKTAIAILCLNVNIQAQTNNNTSQAFAELSVSTEQGGLTDYYGSPDVLRAEAVVEAIHHLGSRTLTYGSISYTNFTGNDMGGSAFLSPLLNNQLAKSHQSALSPLTSHLSPLTTHLPFDLVEDSLNTTGRKHADVYRLCGGVTHDLWQGITIGTSLDYTAANYAKYKDLRHKNKLMDLTLTAGIDAQPAKWIAIGASYIYRRQTESLQFSTYGKGDRTYQTLISYGAFMGRTEQFGSSGYTDRSHEMPLVSDINGLKAHLSLFTPHSSLFTSFTYAHRTGYYGRKSPYTITYTNHQSDIYRYEATFSVGNGSAVAKPFSLYFSLQAENLENHASTYREQLNDAGATAYEYYAPVKTANKLWVSGTIALTTHLTPHTSHLSPLASHLWTLTAGLDWQHRKQSAYLFPFMRRQKIDSREWYASATRNIPLHHDKTLSLSARFAFREGDGQPFADLTMATPSDKATTPATMDACLYREYQWLTAPQYSVTGAATYSFPMPKSGINTYIKGILSHRKANVDYPFSNGRDRIEATIAVGCTF